MIAAAAEYFSTKKVITSFFKMCIRDRRYRGYVYDTETGLYYLSSRYYNPVWGRFINADTAAVVAASPDKACLLYTSSL